MTKQEQKDMANRIKSRRKQLNYTQEQFSEQLGISASSYTRIENAFQNPSMDTLIKISKNLKISLDYIVFGEGNDEPRKYMEKSDRLSALLDYSDGEKLNHAAEVLRKIAKIKFDETDS